MKTFTRKMALLVLVGLIAWMNGNAQTIINGGNVSGKWTKAESPYQVNGNITVAQGTTLEIEPGVTAAFANGAGLIINGQLLAEGTSDDNIVFTEQVAGAHWRGLIFSAMGESESVVKYASIKYTYYYYSDGWGHYDMNYGGVYITSGTVTLSNNDISNNSSYAGTGGVYITGGTVTLSNNTISNNSYRGINIGGGTVTLSNNDISNNNGGISIINSSVVTMRNNTVRNNVYTSSNGGGIYMENSTVDMYNNIISGNSAISAGGGVYVNNMIAGIRNNVISNNKHAVSKSGNGGGISLYNSSSMIINNTIAYNDAENGGGMYCAAGSSPVVIDNIIYGNTSSLESQVFINDNNSAPKMLYNLNQCGCLGYAAGVNYNWDANYDASNFDANPQFVNYALQNYRLKDTSPCINAGIEDVTGLGLPSADVDGNIRIYGGRIDIGAYEYGAPTGIENVTVQQQLMIYPNPSHDGIFKLATDSNNINWAVYDMKGMQISKGNTPLVDLSFFQKGIYVIKVQTGKNIVTGKLVKL